MHLDYRTYPPSAALGAYVECFWTLRGTVAPAAQPDRVLPDGRAELVWNLADPFRRHLPGAPPRRQPGALLVGQITQAILLQPTGVVDLVGARLRPAAFGALLGGGPAHRLTDLDFAIGDVAELRLRLRADQLADATTGDARVAIADAGLATALRAAPALDPRVQAATAAITASHGRASIDAIASTVQLGVRQLERRFLADVGIGPKRFARIARFRHLLDRLGDKDDGADGWARTAIRCGYFDQAHLIRDFREFAGAPPARFLAGLDRPLTDAFLADD